MDTSSATAAVPSRSIEQIKEHALHILDCQMRRFGEDDYGDNEPRRTDSFRRVNRQADWLLAQVELMKMIGLIDESEWYGLWKTIQQKRRQIRAEIIARKSAQRVERMGSRTSPF